MTRQTVLAVISGTCLLLSGPHAAGQEAAQPAYRIKPSDVAVPADVKLGQYQRTTRPFENWTLICDENLQARKKVCNISQSFIDQGQALVFSWSLAADEKGKPFMILRTPSAAGEGSKLSLRLAGRKQPVDVQLQGCDASVCVGYVPVGPVLREQIGKETTVQVSYSLPSGATVSLDAPFKGLKTALSTIN
ncbi:MULTISPECIES: invasion associated locus B family protein [unclassified Mesorhizobium]|uniref:invasion associated locus B family protein n=1 Tax=unclassified Mesorhizobium TaxID=325217 RepID=UPI00112CAD31|nr:MULTISPECIES: invasion associated locus B family protein [unclassified Mesorhizobium]TPL01845.1 invasion associated locus B family protein [Mesorhizobium sp. B2-4-16]TPL68890.1 invasion associated locus B family protein [Mesorhizobium sp. B2-4-3]